MKAWLSSIRRMGACGEAIEWGEQYGSLEDAWADCERGDWMLWLAGKLSGRSDSDSRKKLVLTACECARLALSYVKEGENRPLKAIEEAEKWARGEDGITLQDVRDAADAARAAARDVADAYAYAAAARDAARDAYAYTAAAYAAAYAAAAADVAWAAYAAAYAAAWTARDAADAEVETCKKCADIVRKHYPVAPSREVELWRSMKGGNKW